ncbi:hypothetical protein EGM51_11775 [Verrucomicrobia bacterium S94]|nr:hypothetical protein EGM51_11775 [Verrucomicrobia bacterium S94]
MMSARIPNTRKYLASFSIAVVNVVSSFVSNDVVIRLAACRNKAPIQIGIQQISIPQMLKIEKMPWTIRRTLAMRIHFLEL